jgi:hypothetical protein
MIQRRHRINDQRDAFKARDFGVLFKGRYQHPVQWKQEENQKRYQRQIGVDCFSFFLLGQ